jgi:hypothetical protein
MSVGSNVVPQFVKARTPEQLIRKMAATSARRGTHIPYFDIQKEDGQWYAWYNTELKLNLNKGDNDGISKE